MLLLTTTAPFPSTRRQEQPLAREGPGSRLGQNVPVGSTPTDTIGPRSRSRLSARYVLVVLKWRKNRSIFKARRVFSFDIVQSDSFLCQPNDEQNREAFVCESDHSRLATIIVDVPVAIENLPVVWMAYKRQCCKPARHISHCIVPPDQISPAPQFSLCSKENSAPHPSYVPGICRCDFW